MTKQISDLELEKTLDKAHIAAPLTQKIPAGFNSVKEYIDSLRNSDQALYDTWAETKSKKDMTNLITSLSPLIYQEVRRQGTALPTAALSGEAKKWAIKAVLTYDPVKGAGLSTHVVNYLQKVRRMNYNYQNAARLPENMQLEHGAYTHAKSWLTEELSRDPTDAELAARLGWSKPKVVRFKDRTYSDLIESGTDRPYETSRFNEGAIIMEHILGQLDYQEKFIWDNSKVMSASELAKNMGININRLNYLKAKLIEKVKKIREEAGVY